MKCIFAKITKFMALLLSMIFLCGCTGIQTTVAPPTVEPETEVVSNGSSKQQHGGMYEENGKFYLDLELHPEVFANHPEGALRIDTKMKFSSLAELVEKWRTCDFTEQELYQLSYTVWDRLDHKVPIMNPDELFYPVEESGAWKNAQVVWSPLDACISFWLKNSNYASGFGDHVITYWYEEKCEIAEDAFAFVDIGDWCHGGKLDEFTNLPDSMEQTSFWVGKQNFIKFSKDQYDHYHYQDKTDEGEDYYICVNHHPFDCEATMIIFSLYNGYYVAEYTMHHMALLPANCCEDLSCYTLMAGPLLSTEFVRYQPAEE